MKNFKVSLTLRSSVENVLKRRAIPYKILENKVFVDLSGEQFHKIVIRAKMEKLQEEKGSLIPILHRSEVEDMTVLEEVGNAYIVL